MILQLLCHVYTQLCCSRARFDLILSALRADAYILYMEEIAHTPSRPRTRAPTPSSRIRLPSSQKVDLLAKSHAGSPTSVALSGQSTPRSGHSRNSRKTTITFRHAWYGLRISHSQGGHHAHEQTNKRPGEHTEDRHTACRLHGSSVDLRQGESQGQTHFALRNNRRRAMYATRCRPGSHRKQTRLAGPAHGELQGRVALRPAAAGLQRGVRC